MSGGHESGSLRLVVGNDGTEISSDIRQSTGRCESIALRSPCFAQARGGRRWPPVERMRSNHSGCGQKFPVLHARCNGYGTLFAGSVIT